MDEFKLMEQVKEELCFVSKDFQKDLRTASLAREKKRSDTQVVPIDYLGGENEKELRFTGLQ